MKSQQTFAKTFSCGMRAVVAIAVIAAGTSARAGTNYKVIHNFTGSAASGSFPVGNLVADAAGNFYGVTSQSADTSGFCYDTGCGAIFKLYPTAAGGWAAANLHTFTGGLDGDSPQGGLVMDAAGNLYGTTSLGGVDSLGDVFELTPTSSGGWKYSVIYNFGYPITEGGEEPEGTMVVDSAGNLYGSTVGGGAEGYGTIFELSPSSSGTWTETILYSFLESSGRGPEGALIFDSAGNLYGTTYNGGDLACGYGIGCGTVFELSPNGSGGWSESVLHSFTGGFGEGKYPAYAGVIFDSAGNLYGTTSGGGHNSECDGGCGTVYKLSPNGSGGWTETVIHSFTGSDGTPGAGGAWPVYSLTADASGNLYGNTYLGGTAGEGVVFKMTPSGSGWVESVVHSFSGSGGERPYNSGLVFGPGGLLYGMTALGGTMGFGTVFEVTP
jgi:uncharacterized repeat protein (TIGR03803 family)